MSLRKPGNKKETPISNQYESLYKNEYDTYLDKVGTNNNFEFKPISLEDIDAAVYQEFNKKFKIREKFMPLISGDAEITSIHMENYEQYDQDKQFLNGPYFIFTRIKTLPLYRTAQVRKSVIFAVAKMKPQGKVIEEWICEPPIVHELIYEFRFITVFRESMNEMQQHFAQYFRNKRNILLVNNERFSIGPESQDDFGNLETINRDDVDARTNYMYTFRMKLYGWTRTEPAFKRERPNSITLDIKMSPDDKSQPYIIDRFEINTK